MENDKFITLAITRIHNMSPKNLDEKNFEKFTKERMFSALAEEILRIAENNLNLVKFSNKVSPVSPESFRELNAELTLINLEELKRLLKKDAGSFTAKEIGETFDDFCANFCESREVNNRFKSGPCINCKAMEFSQFLEDKLEKRDKE